MTGVMVDFLCNFDALANDEVEPLTIVCVAHISLSESSFQS